MTVSYTHLDVYKRQEGGSHPSPTENSKMSIMPSQKLGMDMPTIDPTRARLSHRVYCFVADIMPKVTPTTVAMTILTKQSIRAVSYTHLDVYKRQLVDNALKYTPQGGKVALSVREFELFCAIQVEDNGPGIPEGEQGAIFGRFYRGEAVRDQEGLGIGLYLAREVVTREGGYIRLNSSPGQGSRFSLYLPKE